MDNIIKAQCHFMIQCNGQFNQVKSNETISYLAGRSRVIKRIGNMTHINVLYETYPVCYEIPITYEAIIDEKVCLDNMGDFILKDELFKGWGSQEAFYISDVDASVNGVPGKKVEYMNRGIIRIPKEDLYPIYSATNVIKIKIKVIYCEASSRPRAFEKPQMAIVQHSNVLPDLYLPVQVIGGGMVIIGTLIYSKFYCNMRNGQYTNYYIRIQNTNRHYSATIEKEAFSEKINDHRKVVVVLRGRRAFHVKEGFIINFRKITLRPMETIILKYQVEWCNYWGNYIK